MRLKAWMESYFSRSRQKKSKKDKKQNKNSNESKKSTKNDDLLNGNGFYEEISFLDNHTPKLARVKPILPVLDQDRPKFNQQTTSTSSIDVRRTPLLGIRSATYSRNNSINENECGLSKCDSLCSRSPRFNNSLSNVQLESQLCTSPVVRSKIKTNPWYKTLKSSADSTYSTLSSSMKSFRLRSSSSEFSSAMDELSSYAADSSNASTLDSAYRTPILNRGQSSLKESESPSLDPGYISQDSRYQSLKSQKKVDDTDTDDSGTLMEKEWSSPEVECCDIIQKKTIFKSIDEVDEAYSEDSSLPPETPETEARKTLDANRTIKQICGSLEEKVQRLRFERLLVEEKINEAREEERIRCEEKMKFQKELIVHRRQILLKTLQNIRFKLEDQSQRLQDAYSTTLGMQLTVRKNL